MTKTRNLADVIRKKLEDDPLLAAQVENERLQGVLNWVLADIRKWWSFSNSQQHTHSWHSREDFIEELRKRILPPPHR
jgi:hypothetical protein